MLKHQLVPATRRRANDACGNLVGYSEQEDDTSLTDRLSGAVSAFGVEAIASVIDNAASHYVRRYD